MDFMFDRMAEGRVIKSLTIVDDPSASRDGAGAGSVYTYGYEVYIDALFKKSSQTMLRYSCRLSDLCCE